jgi:hypothetical protein
MRPCYQGECARIHPTFPCFIRKTKIMNKIQAISLAAMLSLGSAAAFAGGPGSVSTPSTTSSVGAAGVGFGATALTSNSTSSVSGTFNSALTVPGHIDATVSQGNQSFSNASLTFGSSYSTQNGNSQTYGQTANGYVGQTGTTNTSQNSSTLGFTSATQSGSQNFNSSVINTSFDGSSGSYGGSGFQSAATASGKGTANANGDVGIVAAGGAGSITGGLRW